MAAPSALNTRPATRFHLLDPMRGVAAMWVFTFHYTFSESFRLRLPWLSPIFQSGHLGVPMFFVISGYCLMAAVRLAARDGESVGAFLRRRSLRIYPPYWLSVAVVASLPFVIEAISALKTGTFYPPSAEGNVSLGYLRYGLIEWVRVLTLTQVFTRFPEAGSLQVKFTTLNAVYWTLAIEFQFYLVMAMALALRTRAVTWLMAVSVVSLVISFAGIWRVVGIFLPYWPMFATGILLYVLLERGCSFRVVTRATNHTGAMIAVAALVSGFLVATILGHLVSDLGFAMGLAVALWCMHDLDEPYAAALRDGSALWQAALRSFKLLGLMSYSIYLLHGRVQFLADQLCRQIVRPSISLDVMVICTTCGLCYVFYRYCERPFILSRPKVAVSESDGRPRISHPTHVP